jgi:hypothetical protein
MDPLASSLLFTGSSENRRRRQARQSQVEFTESKKGFSHGLLKLKRTGNMWLAEPNKSKTKKGKD